MGRLFQSPNRTRFRQLTDRIGFLPLPPWNNDNRKNTSLGTLATLSILRAVSGENADSIVRRARVHRWKNERLDKSSGWREGASEKIQGGTSVSVKFTTNIFLPPPRKRGRIYVSRLRRRTRASQPQGRRKLRRSAYISLCHTPARVHNIERNNPPSPRPRSRFRVSGSYLFPQCEKRSANLSEAKLHVERFIQVYIVVVISALFNVDRAICVCDGEIERVFSHEVLIPIALQYCWLVLRRHY